MRRKSVIAAFAALLVLSACSSGHGDDDTSAAADGSSTSTTAAAATTAKFGTLDSPCGPGDAKGATANGVTDTEITIGYGDDAGYAAAPGLDKEMSDAIKPMIEWCNEQGGINGRKVVGNYYDAAVLQVTQAVTKACNDKIFMLVGQGWVLDQGQETARIACKIATIPTYAVSTTFAHAPGMVQPLPNPGDQVPISAASQLAALFPDAVQKAAFVFAEFPATREPRDRYAAAFPKAGWKFLDCDQIYNIAGESDWKPFATNLKSCGVETVVWVGSPDPMFENLLAAAKQVGFEPKWISDSNQYDASFAKWNGENGGAGDNVYLRMATVPFELADQVPAVKQYVDMVEGSGGKVALLGEQATSAFLLWATAVKACGSNVTQKCVLEEAGKQEGWTGGGLHTPSNPGKNEGPKCGLLMKLDGASWEKVTPKDDVFECKDSYLATGISTPALAAAKLDANRVSTQFGTFTP
jgi:ABC-type branched-subunit amino acid transport system substrate-binding protein